MTVGGATLNTAVVGVDFSAGAKQALKMAALLQSKGELKVSLQHVVDSHGIKELADVLSTNQDELVQELQDKGAERMLAWAEEVNFGTTPEVKSGFGDPAKELIEASKDTDLLIMGERGESHPGRGVGATAVKIIRKSRGRVLLVDGTKEETKLDKIVVGVDFTEASPMVIQEAVLLADYCGAEVEFLHVYRAPWDRLHYRAPTAESSPHFQREYLAMLQKKMDACLEGVDYAKQSNVLHRCSSYGYGIADFVRVSSADLVVIGTHGRKSLKELYLGSTAERLLRELPCSVMTVRTG